MCALIIVDVQNDFVAGGALAVPDGNAVVPIANALMERFDVVVATQDWHPANHGSFAAQHEGKRPGEVIELDGISQVLWPMHCVQHTPGADFAPGLDRAGIHRIFPKGTDPNVDSYSGFFDNGRRRETGLEGFLRELEVEEVYILGLATDYCVKFTAIDAAALGFVTFVIEDGCRGVGLQDGDVERAWDEMRAAGVRVVRSADVPLENPEETP